MKALDKNILIAEGLRDWEEKRELALKAPIPTEADFLQARREIERDLMIKDGLWEPVLEDDPRVILRAGEIARDRAMGRRKARRLGLAYWPALVFGPGCDPRAFVIAEKVMASCGAPLWGTTTWDPEGPKFHSGGWDSKAHYGLSAREVGRLWWACGCARTRSQMEMFRAAIARNYRARVEIPGIKLSIPGKGWSQDKFSALVRGRKMARRLGLVSAKHSALVILGRMSPEMAFVAASVSGEVKGASSLNFADFKDLRDQILDDRSRGTAGLVRRVERLDQAATRLGMDAAPGWVVWSVVKPYMGDTTGLTARQALFLAVAGIRDADQRLAEVAQAAGQAWFELVSKGLLTKARRLAWRLGARDAHTVAAVLKAVSCFGGISEAEGWLVRAQRLGLSLHDAGSALPATAAPEAMEWFRRVGTTAACIRQAARILPLYNTIKGRGWNPVGAGSLQSAIEMAQLVAYKDVIDIDLAQEAARWGTSERDFARIQERWLRARAAHRTCEIPPPGGISGLRAGTVHLFQMEKSDPRMLFVGNHTGCCQHPGGAGESSAWFSVEEDRATVWAAAVNGRIVAQSLVWRQGDTLVLDNIEAMGHEAHASTIAGLYQQACIEALGVLGIRRVVQGTGMNDILIPAAMGKEPMANPADLPPCYTDAERCWEVAAL